MRKTRRMGVSQTTQQVNCLPHKPDGPSQSQEPTLGWKERNGSTQLPSDLHMHTMACVSYTHTHHAQDNFFFLERRMW